MKPADRRPIPLLVLVALSLGAPLLSACGAATSGGASPGGDEVTVISTELGEYRIERRRDHGASSARLAATQREVYAALPGVYRDLGIPLGTVDSDRFLVGNTAHRASRRIAGVRMSHFFRCGRSGGFGTELAEAGPIRISILSRVQAEGADGARIRTEASAQASATDGTSTRRSECASTGALEGLIVAMVEERLAAQ